MPWRYTIDAERKLVASAAWGRMTLAELQAHQDQLANDPQFNPEFSQLVDATAITELNISLDDARKLMGRKLFSRTSRRAFIGNGLSVTVAKHFMQAYAFVARGREQISIFHERDAAIRWLGVSNPPRNSRHTAPQELIH